MDFNDSLSDEDEELLQFLEHERRPYKVSEKRPEHFNKWDDTDFQERFRLQKETVLLLLELIEEHLETPTDR